MQFELQPESDVSILLGRKDKRYWGSVWNYDGRQEHHEEPDEEINANSVEDLADALKEWVDPETVMREFASRA